MRPVISLLLLFLFVWATQAKADILFVDLNFSSKEILTAKKAAKARGEKLVVIPEVSETDREMLDKLKEELKKTQKELDDVSKNKKLKNSLRNSKKEVLDEKIAKLNETLQDVKAKYKIAHTHLEEVLKQYGKNSKTTLSSLIISGHHSVNFFGENGSEIRYDDIEKLAKEYPEAFKEVKSIYLWGCYTLTKSQVIFWKNKIPSAYMLGGWDGSAPRDDKLINHEALLKLLTNEKKYSALTDLKQSVALFNSIKGAKTAHPAICVGSNYISNIAKEDISDFLSKCNTKEVEQFKQKLEIVKKFRYASEANYEDVPKNTGNSELRDIYSLGRLLQHCDPTIQSEVDKMIFLIFDKQIRKNLTRVFDNEIKKIDDIYAGLNQPGILDRLRNENAKRSEIIQEINRLSNTIYNSESLHMNSSDKAFLQNMHYKLEQIISFQNCMSPLWIEDVASSTLKQSVSCRNYSEMGLGGTNMASETGLGSGIGTGNGNRFHLGTETNFIPSTLISE